MDYRLSQKKKASLDYEQQLRLFQSLKKKNITEIRIRKNQLLKNNYQFNLHPKAKTQETVPILISNYYKSLKKNFGQGLGKSRIVSLTDELYRKKHKNISQKKTRQIKKQPQDSRQKLNSQKHIRRLQRIYWQKFYNSISINGVQIKSNPRKYVTETFESFTTKQFKEQQFTLSTIAIKSIKFQQTPIKHSKIQYHTHKSKNKGVDFQYDSFRQDSKTLISPWDNIDPQQQYK